MPQMLNETWSMETVSINGPDDLREATRGADLEIVQLTPGKLRGSIKHLGIGNLGISTGQRRPLNAVVEGDTARRRWGFSSVRRN